MNIQGIHSNAIPMAATASGSTNSTSSSSSSSSANSSNSGAVSSNGQISESSFLQLIATELQAQDPTNPLDPAQFMGQLVQFNTLDQVTGIYNLLSQGAAGSTTTSASSSSTGSSASSATSPSASTSSATQGL
jgi:flagellar basal-body rod modification protein FlgD